MTEASGGSMRSEVQRRLVQRSIEDENFGKKLLEDPKWGPGAGAGDAAA